MKAVPITVEGFAHSRQNWYAADHRLDEAGGETPALALGASETIEDYEINARIE